MATTAFVRVPTSEAQVLDPEWMTEALQGSRPGVEIEKIELVEGLRSMASKVRAKLTTVTGEPISVCIKAFLDADDEAARFHAVSVREAEFYERIAPLLPMMRLVDCLYSAVDTERGIGIVILDDLKIAGARFMSALEPFDVAMAQDSLGQLALLHARFATPAVLDSFPWIDSEIVNLAERPVMTVETLQGLMDGPRKNGLPGDVIGAARIDAGLKALAERQKGWQQTLIHGDVHAGNTFRNDAGICFLDWQILQKGAWALDVSYHINAVLPVELAEKHEQDLLRHYLDAFASAGGEPPRFDAAWDWYREGVAYGYYLWAMTRRVAPEIVERFVNRLGNAVARHDSYGRLGV